MSSNYITTGLALFSSIVTLLGLPVDAEYRLPSMAPSTSLNSTQAIENQAIKNQAIKKKPTLGGADGGGGGTGIACFKSGVDISTVKDSNGVLKPGMVDKIQDIFVLDAVKAGNLLPFHKPIKKETPRAYIDRILDVHYSKINPIFVQKIKDTLNELIVKWEEDAGPLPVIHDFEFANNWSDFCTNVQIVIRHSRIWIENKKVKSDFYVQVDHSLLNIIRSDDRPGAAVFAEGTLMLHEALYQIATEMGHQDANKTHQLLAFLLSTQTTKTLASTTDPIQFFSNKIKSFGF